MKANPLLALLATPLLSMQPGQARPDVFPQTCHFNGKPEACMVSAFGRKEDPDNDVEIWWQDGALTTIRYQSSGPVEVGEPVIVDGEQGSIYRVRSCAAPGQASYLCTQVTVLKPPGTLYTYVFGD